MIPLGCINTYHFGYYLIQKYSIGYFGVRFTILGSIVNTILGIICYQNILWGIFVLNNTQNGMY